MEPQHTSAHCTHHGNSQKAGSDCDAEQTYEIRGGFDCPHMSIGYIMLRAKAAPDLGLPTM